MIKKTYLIFLILLLVQCKCQEDMNALLNSILKEQNQKSTEYFPKITFPPLSFQKEAGLFESYIHLNFHGDVSIASVRNLFQIPDNNGFVTMFVTQCLLEAEELNQIQIDDKVISNALKAIGSHKAKNLGFPQRQDVPVYNFWNTVVVKDGSYAAQPDNLAIPLGLLQTVPDMVLTLLNALGKQDLANKLKPILKFPSLFLDSFHIPADSDDTGVNLALGATLYENQQKFKQAYQTFEENNQNIGQMYEVIKKYAYRPFSQNLDENTIDTRSYYWLRNFIDDEYDNKNSQLAIITTWMMRVYEQKTMTKMPFNANNVDGSVVANMLFGITKSILRNPEAHIQFFDSEIENIYVSSAKVLEYILKNNLLSDRSDLILLYYPPILDFYWFTARLSNLLNNESSLPFKCMENVRDMLNEALETYGTQQLITFAQEENEFVYWEDFLGNGDSFLGKARPQHEDRVFSTSVGINALIDIWSVKSKTGDYYSLSYKKTVPLVVKSLISKGINWLLKESHKFSHENTFFSGSVKGFNTTLPFWYPANVLQYINGTKFGCELIPNPASTDIMVVVSGRIDKQEYEQKLKTKCLGHEMVTKKDDFNCLECVFPYWSSPALTKSFKLLAYAKYNSLQQ